MPETNTIDLSINDAFLGYQHAGYCAGPVSFDDASLGELRASLESSFSNQGLPRDLGFFQIENTNSIQQIVDTLCSPWMNTMLQEMSDQYKTPVSILPPFKIKRNYHIDRSSTAGIGWHRDCGGELRYDYCKQRISSNNAYVFGKVGIYLQENKEYGGAIDVIPFSHTYLRDGRDMMNKVTQIPFLAIKKIQHVFPKIYTKLPESLYMKALRAKKITAKPSTAMLFDSRLLHRGSPIADSVLEEVDFFGTMQAKTPKESIKYAIYVHFGSAIAAESYLYDRKQRADCANEFEEWQREGRLMKKYSPQISASIQSILAKVKY